MWDYGQYSERIAVIDENDRQVTYQELEKEGIRLSEQIGGRCLIFIVCTNQLGSLLGYTSCIQNHVVPVMLAETMDGELLNNMLEEYQPKYIWKPNTMLGETDNVVYQKYEYALVKTKYQKEVMLNEQLALLLTTSGSTGSQKLVRISYQNLESNTKSIVTYLKLNKEERPILALPMSYTYGLSIINTHLFVGACLLLSDRKVIQKSFWEFFRKYEGTSFSGVPHTYEVLEKVHFFQMKLDSLTTLTQAGGKLSERLQKSYADYALKNGISFVVMYGQTEATARISYLPPENCLKKMGSIGVAIPDGTLSIRDQNGNCIEQAGIEGELVYEGGNVTLGYAQCQKDLEKGDERGGILYTGDLGHFDEDGYFYISGRKDRYIKVLGNRISLDEVEGIIRTGKLIDDVACAGKEDNIYIFLTDENISEEIKKYIAEKMGLNKSVFHTNIIKEIPRNNSGKIQYKKLNEVIV